MSVEVNLNLQANLSRIQHDITKITKVDSSGHDLGCTRHSYTSDDAGAREYLLHAFHSLGLRVNFDGVGNIRARFCGQDDTLPPVLVGSHIDTVTNGGRFDGLLGVVCALETVRVLKENEITPLHPIEIIIFAEEEGSNFGITLLGSKALVGKLHTATLQNVYNDKGESADEVIRKAGYEANTQIHHVIQQHEVKAMLELHIEQGGILDHIGCSIGVVQSIAGMRTYKVVFTGVPNHAGSTPMPLRKDPMLGAAYTILELQNYTAQYGNGTVVATVGKLVCQPNSTNAIAGKTELYVDIRDVDISGIRSVGAMLESTVRTAAKKYHLESSVEIIAESEIVRLNAEIIGLLEDTAKNLKLYFHRMNSGAVHDAVMMTDVTKVGMIFVTSIDGLSHCPQEDTRYEDIEKGCNLLIQAVAQLAGC